MAQEMSTFTVVVHDVVTIGVEEYDIHPAVMYTEALLLMDQPHGNKVTVRYGLLWRGGDAYHLATLTLQNVRKRPIDTALVWGEQPLIPRQQFHATDHRTPISCRECGSLLFYNVDRSLDYKNHICAGCKHPAQTITETGASA
jgi:hypothetical protein